MLLLYFLNAFHMLLTTFKHFIKVGVAQNTKAKYWFHQQKPATETQRIPPQGSKLPKRPNTKSSSTATNQAKTSNGTSAAKKTAASLAATQRREAQRQQLLELKRKNKASAEQPVEIFQLIPDTSSWFCKN